MPEVCLVVPCYNEERRFSSDAITAFLGNHPDLHVCLVDDGSVDGTLARLEELRSLRANQVLIHRLATNRGKAEAVRCGVLEAASLGRFTYIGYWDADLSTPLEEMDHLLAVLIGNPHCQLVLGSRVKRLGSHIERRAMRHVCGRLFATAVSVVLDVSCYDSQCGAKIFRREVVSTLFARPFLTRWLFDLELLLRLRMQAGSLDSVIEVPLEHWREVMGSKLRLRDVALIPLELVKIRSSYSRDII